jgi:hypothetical protein
MPSNTFRTVRRVRTDFSGAAAITSQRRRSDRDPALRFPMSEHEPRHGSEARLVLYFAAVLVCTACGVALEEMRMAGAAWSLFIVGAAFLLAAVRTLFVAPSSTAKRS